jgi:signal recognition particle subunit SRP54
MVPGGYDMPDNMFDIAENKLDSWRFIIQSMCKNEIENPKIMDSSRIRRIARGSGRSEKDVKELFSQYGSMRKMMKSMKRQKSKFMRRLPVQS